MREDVLSLVDREFEMSLVGKIESTNHLYASRGKIRYMTKKGKEQKARFAEMAELEMKGRPPIDEPVVLFLQLNFGDKRIRDIDNYSKIILDAMSGIVYTDDKLIHAKFSFKTGGNPETSVEVRVGRFKNNYLD